MKGPAIYDNFASDMYSVQETRDGGYIYSGANNRVMYLLKTDASGNKQWDHVYGPTDGVAGANSVQQTWDGGYILAGFYPKPEGPNMMEVVRTDASGNELWEKAILAWDTPMEIRSCRSVMVLMRSQGGRRPITTASVTSI